MRAGAKREKAILEGGMTPLEEALAKASRSDSCHALATEIMAHHERLHVRADQQERGRQARQQAAQRRLAARTNVSVTPLSSPPLEVKAPSQSPIVPRPTAARRAPWQNAATFAVLSLSAHALLMFLLPAGVAPATSSPMLAVTVELADRLVPGVGPETTGGRVPDTEASRVTPGGAHPLEQNVDAADPGVGGDGRGAIEIVLLVPHADEITLTDAPWNAVGPSQTSRIHVADDRATFEERRATPHPSDTPFVASGDGTHAERRPDASTDAREGARLAPLASTAGMASERHDAVRREALRGATATPEDTERSTGLEGRPDRESTAAVTDSPGLGILEGTGTRASEAARVATGRPAVDPGSASTTADARGRTRDDVDAELLAARTSESFVESSRRAGTESGDGVGARDALGVPGVGGGREEGGRAHALGTGDGGFEALDTRDARYRRWILDLTRRLEDHMIWPRARVLAMDQGASVFRVTLRRDGSLLTMRLIRSSGFDDLDRAAQSAIESRPFEPVPEEIAPGDDQVTVPIRLVWANPMVR